MRLSPHMMTAFICQGCETMQYVTASELHQHKGKWQCEGCYQKRRAKRKSKQP